MFVKYLCHQNNLSLVTELVHTMTSKLRFCYIIIKDYEFFPSNWYFCLHQIHFVQTLRYNDTLVDNFGAKFCSKVLG